MSLKMKLNDINNAKKTKQNFCTYSYINIAATDLF